MENSAFSFRFGNTKSLVSIRSAVPTLFEILEFYGPKNQPSGVLVVCDPHTEKWAQTFLGENQKAEGASRYPTPVSVVVLPAGESHKGWSSVETILQRAVQLGMGRDGLFIGIGGGVITDLTAFAASVYMRGASLCLIPTTLLAMADAAVGGKAGFDLFTIKNLVGTFRPADRIDMASAVLESLPEREWKSGLAEVIKTAIIGDGDLLSLLETHGEAFRSPAQGDPIQGTMIQELIRRCVLVKGRIVEADPEERGTQRALLNLGHTFGHALETTAGLGNLTHGEAVAWGIARSVELGRALGITTAHRGERILALLRSYGYETGTEFVTPRGAFQYDPQVLLTAMEADKKKKAGQRRFIVPDDEGARLVSLDTDEKTGLLVKILQGTSEQ